MANKPRDPIDLLTPDPTRIPHIFENGVWGPLLGGIMGFGFGIVNNFLMRRPVFSSVQMHVIFMAVGSGIGTALERFQDRTFAERDAVLRHYVELHPEDFVQPERVKYGELFAPWIPVR